MGSIISLVKTVIDNNKKKKIAPPNRVIEDDPANGRGFVPPVLTTVLDDKFISNLKNKKGNVVIDTKGGVKEIKKELDHGRPPADEINTDPPIRVVVDPLDDKWKEQIKKTKEGEKEIKKELDHGRPPADEINTDPPIRVVVDPLDDKWKEQIDTEPKVVIESDVPTKIDPQIIITDPTPIIEGGFGGYYTNSNIPGYGAYNVGEQPLEPTYQQAAPQAKENDYITIAIVAVVALVFLKVFK